MTTPRHPLADALIDAGAAADAVIAATDSAYLEAEERSFKHVVEPLVHDEAADVELAVADWAAHVKRSPVVDNVTNLVKQLAWRLVEQRRATAGDASCHSAYYLYRIYLDNFVEYMTLEAVPSHSGTESVCSQLETVRRRYGVFADVSQLRAQALGLVDAAVASQGYVNSGLPRVFADFCCAVGAAPPPA